MLYIKQERMANRGGWSMGGSNKIVNRRNVPERLERVALLTVETTEYIFLLEKKQG
jgi:hypothetical protein